MYIKDGHMDKVCCRIYLRCTSRSKNVSGDEEKDDTPRSSSCGTRSLSPFKIGDTGMVVMSSRDGAIRHNCVHFMNMAFGESVLDDTAEGPRILSLDQIALILSLFSSSNGSIVKVLLKENRRIVVNLSGLDAEAFLDTSFVAVVESELSGVLLHPRITSIQSEIGEVLSCHVD